MVAESKIWIKNDSDVTNIRSHQIRYLIQTLNSATMFSFLGSIIIMVRVFSVDKCMIIAIKGSKKAMLVGCGYNDN